MICTNLYAFETRTCISLCGTDKGTVSIRFRTYLTSSNFVSWHSFFRAWHCRDRSTWSQLCWPKGMRFCKQVLKGYLLDMPCVTGDSIYPDCFSNARFGANMRIANASCCIYNSNASRLTHLGQTGSTHMSDTLQGGNACTTRVPGAICCWHWSRVFRT